MKWLVLILVCFSSCYHPHGSDKQCIYPNEEEKCACLIFLVDARQLDYSSCRGFFRTVAKHPSDGSKNSDVGHAWIYMQNRSEVIEGGLSGELGIVQPKYIEGVCRLSETGDPNPARYLWESLHDGYFQTGNGGHTPTYAVKVNITEKEFYEIKEYIRVYPFKTYSLTGNNCATFVKKIAGLIGKPLDCSETMELPPACGNLYLWTNPIYKEIVFDTPDHLEKTFREWVLCGDAEPALKWYLSHSDEPFMKRLNRTLDDLKKLPHRTFRFLQCL